MSSSKDTRISSRSAAVTQNEKQRKLDKEQSGKGIARIVVICAVVLALLLLFINTSFFYRNVNTVTITGINGEEKFSIVDFNFYYTTVAYETYSEIYDSYGTMADYVLNPGKPYDEQMYNDTATWDDYFTESAVYTMKNVVLMNDLAEKDPDFALTEEQQEKLEEHFASAKEFADELKISVSRYFQSTYGKGMNEKIYRENYTKLFTAQCFSEYMGAKIEGDYTEEQIAAYYEANPNEFNAVSYRVYTVFAEKGEEVDKEQALKDAKETAEKLAAEVKSIETFEAAVAKYEEENEITSGVGGGHALLASLENTGYGEWLFDSERASGDVTVLANSDETGYNIVYFDELDTLDYNFANVRTTIFYAGQDEETGEITDEAKAEALKSAEAFFEEWKSGDATEDSFLEVSKKYDEDDEADTVIPGQITELYNGVTGVAAIETWALDEARQAGDAELLELATGYVVVYYVGEGEHARTAMVRGTMATEGYNAWVEESVESYKDEIHGFGYYFSRDF